MNYELSNDIATVCIDDGKANVVSHAFVDTMLAHLERAKTEARAVRIVGRAGMFSAGFDLKELQKGAAEADALVARGMQLLTALYSHPQPVIALCDGHAIGLGAFILLASDVRLGSTNEYNVTLPETAIGMPFTPALMALIKARIPSSCQTIAVLESRPFPAGDAVEAGFLDRVVSPEALETESMDLAGRLAQLPGAAYAANKEDLRREALSVMRA